MVSHEQKNPIWARFDLYILFLIDFTIILIFF